MLSELNKKAIGSSQADEIKALKEKYKHKYVKYPTGRCASNKEWLINQLKTDEDIKKELEEIYDEKGLSGLTNDSLGSFSKLLEKGNNGKNSKNYKKYPNIHACKILDITEEEIEKYMDNPPISWKDIIEICSHIKNKLCYIPHYWDLGKHTNEDFIQLINDKLEYKARSLRCLEEIVKLHGKEWNDILIEFGEDGARPVDINGRSCDSQAEMIFSNQFIVRGFDCKDGGSYPLEFKNFENESYNHKRPPRYDLTISPGKTGLNFESFKVEVWGGPGRSGQNTKNNIEKYGERKNVKISFHQENNIPLFQIDWNQTTNIKKISEEFKRITGYEFPPDRIPEYLEIPIKPIDGKLKDDFIIECKNLAYHCKDGLFPMFNARGTEKREQIISCDGKVSIDYYTLRNNIRNLFNDNILNFRIEIGEDKKMAESLVACIANYSQITLFIDALLWWKKNNKDKIIEVLACIEDKGFNDGKQYKIGKISSDWRGLIRNTDFYSQNKKYGGKGTLYREHLLKQNDVYDLVFSKAKGESFKEINYTDYKKNPIADGKNIKLKINNKEELMDVINDIYLPKWGNKIPSYKWFKREGEFKNRKIDKWEIISSSTLGEYIKDYIDGGLRGLKKI